MLGENNPCKSCGSPLAAGQNFCGACGIAAHPAAPVEPPPETQETPKKPKHYVRPVTAKTYGFPLLCNICGFAVKPRDKYCDNCGTKLIPHESADAEKLKAAARLACAACGQAMKPGAKLCGNCGHIQGGPALPGALCIALILDSSAGSACYAAGLAAGFNGFCQKMAENESFAERLKISAVAFGGGIAQTQPLSPAGDIKPLSLEAGGEPRFAEAVRQAASFLPQAGPGVLKPWVVLVSGSEPADIAQAAGECRKMQADGRGRLLALSPGGANAASLKMLTDIVFRQEGADFAPFFEWLARSVETMLLAPPGAKPTLPPLSGNVSREK